MMNPPFSLLGMKSGMKHMGAAASLLGAYQATGGAVLGRRSALELIPVGLTQSLDCHARWRP
jgi:hypothetical protein